MMIKSAIISEDGLYRYSLSRIWNDNLPMVMFIMLNPSIADAEIDDPTIRRCIGFAKSWGFGGLCVGNLFAYRATNPKELLNINDPIGSENINFLNDMFNKSEICVFAWGNSKILYKLSQWENENAYLYNFLTNLNKCHYLELSKNGTPKHPLYLKSDLKPESYIISKEIF